MAHVRFFDYVSGIPWLCRLAGIRTILFTDANGGEWTGTGWRKLLIQLRAKVMCRPLTKIIAISQFISRRLQKVGIAPERIALVYNGVDTSAFVPNPVVREELRKQMGASPETIVLIFAAILLPIKRPEVTLGLCAELVRRGHDIQLWVAGSGPLSQALEQRAIQLGIKNQVKWLGYQKDPQNWMAAADLFVHTAAGEAFGNVFVEAMSCGLPVVASRSGAAPELVDEDATSGTGLLVDVGHGEEAGMADAVLELMRDPARRNVLAQAAIRKSLCFTTDTCVTGTLAVYETLGLRA
jgi:glycosyltransferase involved in cell wall biosynthesis